MLYELDGKGAKLIWTFRKRKVARRRDDSVGGTGRNPVGYHRLRYEIGLPAYDVAAAASPDLIGKIEIAQRRVDLVIKPKIESKLSKIWFAAFSDVVRQHALHLDVWPHRKRRRRDCRQRFCRHSGEERISHRLERRGIRWYRRYQKTVNVQYRNQAQRAENDQRAERVCDHSDTTIQSSRAKQGCDPSAKIGKSRRALAALWPIIEKAQLPSLRQKREVRNEVTVIKSWSAMENVKLRPVTDRMNLRKR
jgi:hypothetical protein